MYAPLEHEADGIGSMAHQTTGVIAFPHEAAFPIPNMGTVVPNSGISDKCAVSGKRVSVLAEAQSLVHGDRNAQYGAPAEEYKRTVGMVNAMLAAKLRVPLDPQDLAYIMICLKLSRQINKPKRDSLTDAAGYCEVAQWIIDSQ